MTLELCLSPLLLMLDEGCLWGVEGYRDEPNWYSSAGINQTAQLPPFQA
jgi:hypothetical protein